MAAVVVAVEAAGVGNAAVASDACRSRYLVRSLYWRLRAGLRRLHSERRGRFSCHYDALSYALNFDNGRASADSLR